MHVLQLGFVALLASANLVFAAEPAASASPAPPAPPAPPAAASTPAIPASSYDAELAKRLGADERGMRKYVLVILKSGPRPVPKGPERDEMFAGHFANITRLAKEGKLALAGPFSQDPSGWRGLYVFAVEDVAAARALTETDPVIVKGEMIAEYHDWYGSAAAMLIPEWHERLAPPTPASTVNSPSKATPEQVDASKPATPPQ